MSELVVSARRDTRLPGLLSPGNSPAALSACAYLAELAARRLSALDYVRACFDRIERFEPVLHAFKTVSRERAEARARAIDEALSGSGRVKALSGVPVGVKDVFNTYDFPTGMGSPILEHYQPGNDARAVSDIRLEDGIIAGKTVTAEFAVHTPGPTVNPHDLARTPGTSSSGSAAAVSSYMVPVALGTQTAGSIVRPASYCGVMGFKPSFGLVPRTAVLKTTDTLDTVGYLARAIEDLRLLFEVTRVRGHNYPVSEAGLADPARQAPAGRPWRVGVVHGPMSAVERPAVRGRLAEAARRLAEAGCEVFDYALPEAFWQAHETHEAIYRRALAYYFQHEWKSHADKFSPRMQAMIEAGLGIAPEAYQAALARQVELTARFDAEASARFDVLIGPSTSDEAPLGLDAEDLPDHCLIWTMAGAPVISLPLLAGTTGLPVGLQLVARRFADYKLLDFADLAWHALAPR